MSVTIAPHFIIVQIKKNPCYTSSKQVIKTKVYIDFKQKRFRYLESKVSHYWSFPFCRNLFSLRGALQGCGGALKSNFFFSFCSKLGGGSSYPLTGSFTPEARAKELADAVGV